MLTLIFRLLPFVFAGVISIQSGRADAVDDWMRQEMARRQIPGALVGVFRDGKPLKIVALGYADIENSVPITTDTVFEIGSITKQFTAAAIMLLREQGKLNLDESLSTYLPEAPGEWRRVTLRHLLTHTSGIADRIGVEGRLASASDAISKLSGSSLENDPGARWSYSNSGYVLLGYVIERVSGESYWSFLKRSIFQPLGMTQTGNTDSVPIVPHRARGYASIEGRIANADSIAPEEGFSACSMHSTLGDLEKWDEALMNGRILRSSSLKLMTSECCLNDGTWAWTSCHAHYGMGFFLNSFGGHRVMMHSGCTRAFSAQNTILPDDHLSVIVLTNLGGWCRRVDVGLEIAAQYLPGLADCVKSSLTLTETKTAAADRQTRIRDRFSNWATGLFLDSDFTARGLAMARGQRESLSVISQLAASGTAICIESVRQGDWTDYRYTIRGKMRTGGLFLQIKDGKIDGLEASQD